MLNLCFAVDEPSAGLDEPIPLPQSITHTTISRGLDWHELYPCLPQQIMSIGFDGIDLRLESTLVHWLPSIPSCVDSIGEFV